MNKQILLAEDDANIANLVKRYVEAKSFKLLVAEDGEKALQLFEIHSPDMVILDLLLPKLDGRSVCEKVRETSSIPIIMLTALNEENDLISGFQKGADDYIAKPFNPRELVVRIQALFRRTEQRPAQNKVFHKNIALSIDERVACISESVVDLTQTEFNLLELFVSNPKKVYTREALLNSSHTKFSDATSRSIDFHIKNLRRKINQHNDDQYIKTVYGVGFKLE